MMTSTTFPTLRHKPYESTPMKIALLSDIHGNHVALELVLDSLRAERVDKVVCLGDVALDLSKAVEGLAEGFSL